MVKCLRAELVQPTGHTYTQRSNSEQSFIGQPVINKQIGEWSACLCVREHNQLSAPWAHMPKNTIRCLKTHGISKRRHPEQSSLHVKNESVDLAWKGIWVPTQPVLTGKFPWFQEYRPNRNETIQQRRSRNETNSALGHDPESALLSSHLQSLSASNLNVRTTHTYFWIFLLDISQAFSPPKWLRSMLSFSPAS